MICPKCGAQRTTATKLKEGHRYYTCEQGHPEWPVLDRYANQRPTAKKSYRRGRSSGKGR